MFMVYPDNPHRLNGIVRHDLTMSGKALYEIFDSEQEGLATFCIPLELADEATEDMLLSWRQRTLQRKEHILSHRPRLTSGSGS